MTTQGNNSVTFEIGELETLIRRVVQEVVHEEILLLFEREKSSPLDDWSHEGPDDPDGDEALLGEALEIQQQRNRSKSAGWQDWETFKTELARSEAAGELPD